LQTFLSGQSGDEVNSEVKPLTDTATTDATNATNAGNTAAAGAKKDTAAGVDQGVFSTTPTAPTPATPVAPVTPKGDVNTTIAHAKELNFVNHGANNPDGTAAGPGSSVTKSFEDPASYATDTTQVAPPAAAGSTIKSAGNYDFSKVNLSGYQGPNAADVSNKFNDATAAGVKASTNAAVLQSGTPTGNAFDNAALTQTPAWSQIQNAITGENTAAANVGAQAQGAAEGVNQANATSAANVAAQKANLGTVGSSLATTAGDTATNIKTVSALLSTGNPSDLAAVLADDQKNPGTLQALGLTRDQVQQLYTQASNNSIGPNQLKAALKGYADAGNNSTGYSSTGAAQENQINTLLKNSAPTAAANVSGSGNVNLNSTAQNNSTDISKLKYAAGTLNTDMGHAPVAPAAASAVKDLVDAGYTAEQIAQFTGIDPKEVYYINSKNG
jgi:hypothetical protein